MSVSIILTMEKSKIFDSDTSHGFMPKYADAEFGMKGKVIGACKIAQCQ